MRMILTLGTFAAVMILAAPAVQACGGHEARAADCLDQLFGDHDDQFTYTTSDHQLHLTTTDGSGSHDSFGTEDEIVGDALDWLASHGMTPTGDDCSGGGAQPVDLFENVELCG